MRKNWGSANLVAMTLLVALVAGSEGANHNPAPVCPKIDPIDRTIHLPHEWDCTKFYKCDHGTPILFQCPLMDHDGNRLHFNPALEVCDWPENAGCNQGPQPVTGDDTLGSTPSTQPIKSTSESIIVSTERTTAVTSNDANNPSTTSSPSVTNPPCGRPCGDVNDGWLIPHECTCDKYYLCSNGDLIRQQCPPGLHFNPKLFNCDYPEVAGCGISTPSPSTIEPTTSVIPSECPGGNNGHAVQLPHPTNCSLFYKCDNGEKQLMSCPEGLHFNPTLQMCDYPQNAGCTATTETTESTDGISTSAATPAITSTEAPPPNTTTNPTTTTTTSPANSGSTSTAPRECPKGHTGPPVSLPHPYNCSLYYTCNDGEKMLQSCPSGLEFNPRKEKCDWPESAGCVASTTEATPTTTASSATSTTIERPSSSPSSTRTPETTESSTTTRGTTQSAGTSQSSSRKPETTEGSSTTRRSTGTASTSPSSTQKPGTTASPSTTQRPTQTASTSQSSTQKPGTTASPSTTQRPTETASTSQSSTQKPGTTASPSTTQRPTETASTSQSSTQKPGTTASPSTTQRPTETANTSESSTRQPGTTESSSTTRRSSQTASSSKATSPSTTVKQTTAKWTTSPTESTNSTSSDSDLGCPPDMDGHQIPHETNCSLYYECKEGKKTLKECTPGLHFSPVLELCVWPANAGCESTTTSPASSSTSADDTSTPEPPSSSSATPSTSEEVTDTTIDPGTGSCIGECPKKDPEDHTVLLAHKDCTKFCQCSNTKPYVQDCPTGLHFSPSKMVCDYPKKAKCKGKGGYGQSANKA